MTKYSWPPNNADHPTDVDHYLAMQGGVAQEVCPTLGEHTLIARRCGVTKHMVLSWRKRKKIPSLQQEPESLAGCDPKSKGNHLGNHMFKEPRTSSASGPPIGTPNHREKPKMSEDAFTELMADRTFDDYEPARLDRSL